MKLWIRPRVNLCSTGRKYKELWISPLRSTIIISTAASEVFLCLGAHAQARYTVVCLCVSV